MSFRDDYLTPKELITMGLTARIIINIVLDIVCLAFSVELIMSRLPAETTKEKLTVAAFALIAVYFVWSLIRKVVYLIKNR